MKKTALVLALVFALSVSMPAFAETGTWGLLSDGEFTLAAGTEIYLAETESASLEDEALLAQVKLFAAELAEKVTGTALPISFGPAEKAGGNDIILILDADASIPAQGYEIVTRAGGSCSVYASDADGLFYGCRKVIKQLLLANSVSSLSDAPDVAERSFSLDNGRKYFTKDWLIEVIKEMSWAEMNSLALHFSEEMGLRLETKLYPWLNGSDGSLCVKQDLTSNAAYLADKDKYLTQAELKEVAAVAKLYHVDIVPSFDSPGHMNMIVKRFNEKAKQSGGITFSYNGTTYNMTHNGTTYVGYTVSSSGKKTQILTSAYGIGNYFSYNGSTTLVKGSRNADYSRGIDISNTIATAFTKSLIEEYAELFYSIGSRTFDIGGDELLGWGSAVVSTSTATRWQQLDHWKTYAQNRAKQDGAANYNKAVAYDAFMYYMNDLNDLVRSKGFTSTRMWNDDALRDHDTGWKQVVTLDKNIDVEYWSYSSNATPEEYVTEGYSLYNYINTYNYYVLMESYFNGTDYPKTNAQSIYNEWNPYVFTPSGSEVNSTTAAKVKGSAFCVWCDDPSLRTEAQVMNDIVPMLRSAGAKAWNKDADNYSSFTAQWYTFGAAPAGEAEVGDIYAVADVAALEAAVKEYETFNAAGYTAQSAKAYADAVAAGEALLAADKPTQEAVNAAVKAIADAKAALVVFVADKTALAEALAAFEATDASEYEEASYAAYAAAAEAARSVYEADGVTQQQVDDAVTALTKAAEGLVKKAAVSEVTCFVKGGFRSTTCNAGKSTYISVTYYTAVSVDHFVIQDDLGNFVTVTKTQHQKVKAGAETRLSYLYFSPTAAQKGARTFTVYAVYTDGSRSADSLTAALTVR